MAPSNIQFQFAPDFSVADQERLQAFISGGVPGISSIPEAQMERMMSQYFEGYSYSRIARSFSVRKEVVLYLAQKFDWYEAKQEYLAEQRERMLTRIADARLAAKDYLLQLSTYLRTVVGKRISKAMVTGDETQGPDLKMIDRSLKALEALFRLADAQDQKPAPVPSTGICSELNAASDGSSDHGDLLRKFADMRRREEAAMRISKKRE